MKGPINLREEPSMSTSRYLAVAALLAGLAQAAAADPPAPAAVDPASPAPAAGAPEEPRFPWSAGGAIGFTVDPTCFLAAFEAGYGVTDNLQVGPLLQVGASDDRTIVAPSANVKYLFDLPDVPEPLDRLKPFVQAGLGLVYMEKERRGRPDKDDTGFLMNVGFGFQYYLTRRFALGNNVLFNIMPDDVVDDHFFFSWQFVSGTFRF